MNILIVYAHPEPRSLNGALKTLAVETLTAQGHQVQVSDLYAMRWKAVADADDFVGRPAGQRLTYWRESGEALREGRLAPDVAAEQQKLLWSDAVILQFPLWWFSMPAIMKGWAERVLTHGFGHGVGPNGDSRYGEGALAGRRALISTTLGGSDLQYSPRGVHGALADVLFPIQHGTLFYPGLTVMEPFAVHKADRATPEDWPDIAQRYRARLDGLFTDAPIPFRRQNGGHYQDRNVLKDGLGAGLGGAGLHMVQPGDPPQS